MLTIYANADIVYYVTRGDKIDIIAHNNDAGTKLDPFYVRSDGTYTNASIAGTSPFKLGDVSSCDTKTSLASITTLYLGYCESIDSTASNKCADETCDIYPEQKDAKLSFPASNTYYTLDIVHVCDYDVIKKDLTTGNSNLVLHKGGTHIHEIGPSGSFATCNIASRELVFDSVKGGKEFDCGNSDAYCSMSVELEEGEYDYFTRYNIKSLFKGEYSISSPKSRVCVYTDIPAHESFPVYDMSQSSSEGQESGSNIYDNNLLTWYNEANSTYEYILPFDSVAKSEVIKPALPCTTFGGAAYALLSTEDSSCKAGTTCEIYNNGETTIWNYTQYFTIGNVTTETKSTHIFYSVQLKMGELISSVSDYYFNTDTNTPVHKDDDFDKTQSTYVPMLNITFDVDTWSGTYDQNKIQELYNVPTGYCYTEQSEKTLKRIEGEEPLSSKRRLTIICYIRSGMYIDVLLRRPGYEGDNLIETKSFAAKFLGTECKFHNITSGTYSIVDNPNPSEEDIANHEYLKTIQLRWTSDGTLANKVDNSVPVFSTVVAYKITRASGEVITNSGNEEIAKLFGPESESTGTGNPDLDFIQDRQELEKLLNENYIFSVIPYQTKYFIFQDSKMRLLNGDKLIVRLFGKFAYVSSTGDEKGIKFKDLYTYNITVCLPSYPILTGLSASPRALLVYTNPTTEAREYSLLFYRPQTQVYISFSAADKIQACGDKMLIDLSIDGEFYQAPYQENTNRYRLDVTISFDGELRRNVRDVSRETKELPSGQYAVQLRDDTQKSTRDDTEQQTNVKKTDIIYNGERVTIVDSRVELTGYVNQYKYSSLDKMGTIFKCHIPEPGRPTLTTTKLYTKPNTDIKIAFQQPQTLYNECIVSETKNFTGYSLKYWTASKSEETAKTLSATIRATSDYNEIKEFIIPSDLNLASNIYNFRVVAYNFVNESGNSAIGTFQICSDFASLTDLKPTLMSPTSEFPATIQDLTFIWRIPPELQVLRCSSEEQHKIVLKIIEVKPSANGARRDEVVFFSRELPPTTQSYRLGGVLLDLSAKYKWTVTVVYEPGNEKHSFESETISFTTVAKHCSKLGCVNGVCDSKTVTCNCFSGYTGKLCNKSVVHVGVIVGAVVGLVAGLVVIGILVFFGVRQRKKYKMGKPNFKHYRFIAPVGLSDVGAVPSSTRVIEEKLAKDPENGFAWAISMLNIAKGDDVTELCRALVYAFERYGHGLDLLLRLVDYEIENAQFVNVLFRNNSIATKCFYAYSHLIGLDYLYELTAPLLNKLFRDQQKNNMQIAVINQHSRFDDVDFEEQNRIGYELNPVLMDDVQNEDYIYTNALSVQLSCQVFISTLLRSNDDCPYEFIRLCSYIKQRFSKKFPESNPNHALSAFLFLRFILAGLSAPKECGFISSHPPDEMRRQLILISKVLSMWSIGDVFDEKEEYMVVMNDFIEDHIAALTKYYDFITTDTGKNRKIIPVKIPEKHYEESIEILGSMDGVLNRNSKKHKKAKKEHTRKAAAEQENNGKHHQHRRHHHKAEGEKKSKNDKTAELTSEAIQPTENEKASRRTDDKSTGDASSSDEQSAGAQESETTHHAEAEQATSSKDHNSNQDESENVNESQSQQDESLSQVLDDITEDSNDAEDSEEAVQQTDDDSDAPSSDQESSVDVIEDITQSDDTE